MSQSNIAAGSIADFGKPVTAKRGGFKMETQIMDEAKGCTSSGIQSGHELRGVLAHKSADVISPPFCGDFFAKAFDVWQEDDKMVTLLLTMHFAVKIRTIEATLMRM
jgi:hypothetical protein